MKPLVLQVQLDLSPMAAAVIMRLVEALSPAARPVPERRRRDWRPRAEPSPAPVVHASAQAPIVAAEPRTTLAPEPPPAAEEPAGRKWTAERKEIIRTMYAGGIATAAIAEALNALPGPPVARKQIAAQAAYLQVRRPPEPAMAEASHEPPGPQPEPDLAPRPEPVTATPSATVGAPLDSPVEGSSPIQVVPADYATIEAWAAPRGLAAYRERLDVPRVNRKRVELGLPPFELTGRAARQAGAA